MPAPYPAGVRLLPNAVTVVALAALGFAPVVAWNAAHGWASFAKQGGRAGAESGGFTLRWVGELVAGQAGLATPIVFALCIAGTAGAVAASVLHRQVQVQLRLLLSRVGRSD